MSTYDCCIFAEKSFYCTFTFRNNLISISLSRRSLRNACASTIIVYRRLYGAPGEVVTVPEGGDMEEEEEDTELHNARSGRKRAMEED